jgi:hypothetical protein
LATHRDILISPSSKLVGTYATDAFAFTHRARRCAAATAFGGKGLTLQRYSAALATMASTVR